MTFPQQPDPDHLSKPAEWTTGGDAATDKQKAFLRTLVSDKGVSDLNPDELGKSEASAQIDRLKNLDSSSAGQVAADNGSGTGTGTASTSTAEKPISDPAGWATGDDPATGKQMGYIAVMAKKAGEDVPQSMGKSEASQKIEELKGKTGM